MAGFAGSGAPLAARAAQLQALQLEEARLDFERETAKIAGSLAALGGEARELESRGLRLFGADEGGEGSFLEALARQLAAARALVNEGLKARAGVDAAKDAVAVTMAELRSRTASLVELAADVTMIGTNASLRSARLGDAGKGITLVAAELRGFGRQIRSAVSQLAASLGRVAAFVDQFSQAQQELEAERLSLLVQRMQAAIEVFGGGGARMSEALRRLGEEAANAREKLERAAEALEGCGDAAPELADAARTIAGFVGELGGAGPARPEIDRLLDERLRPAYSMASERRVHDAFTGLRLPPSPRRPSRRPTPSCYEARRLARPGFEHALGQARVVEGAARLRAEGARRQSGAEGLREPHVDADRGENPACAEIAHQFAERLALNIGAQVHLNRQHREIGEAAIHQRGDLE